MQILRKLATASGMLIAAFTTSAATAQGVDITDSLDADAGTYTPLALGEDLTLDACNSSFNIYTICTLPDLSSFTFNWFIQPAGQPPIFLGAIAGVAGSQFTVSTGGVGDAITSTGTFSILLNLVGNANPFALPDGNQGFYDFSDFFFPGNSSTSPGSAIIITPAAVPEPEGLLLLLPALLYAGLRRRRKTVKA